MCDRNKLLNMPVNNNPFAGKNEINVVFIGGSITEGSGSSAIENCYVNLMGEWFKNTFGGSKTVNCYNEGVGGTASDYGLLRFTRDVVSRSPDMVFIEFAVNDCGNDTRIYLESMIRTLQALPNIPYVVFLYTTNRTYTTPTAYHEEVAAYYGIPQIHLEDAVKRELSGADPVDAGYFQDNVHPGDKGYRVYYEEIKSCLESGRCYQRPVMKEEKLIAESGAVETVFVPIASKGVETSGTDWTTGGGGKLPWAKTETLGATIKFSFDGTILAIEHGLLSASAMYEIYVDGVRKGVGNPYYGGRPLTDSPQPVMGFSDFILPEGRHEAEIKTIKSTDENSTGNHVFLYNIITGRPVR